MRLLIAFAALLIATPAFASPKYLTCAETKTGGGWKLSIAISEEQQFVTFLMNNAEIFVRTEALFSSTQIRWRSSPTRGWVSIFIIDRVNLNITMIEQVGEKITTTKGTCTVDPIPKQAV